MITSKAPEQYWNEPGILAKAGGWIAPLASKVWVLAGKQALAAAGDGLLNSLEEHKIGYEVRIYEGYCTLEDVDQIAGEFAPLGAEAIIGVGGGTVLDTAKAVGDVLGLPVITVPTVPATCAAWSALSVLYDREGAYQAGLILKRSPKLVFADTSILAKAPPRYLAAGIGDTLVKWYEAAPNRMSGPGGIAARTGLAVSKLALDILQDLSLDAYETAGSGRITDAFLEVSNAVIFLAGQAGTLSGGRQRAAVAHAVHNSLTKQHETHHRLHGEKVAFGLVVQLFLEGYSQTKIDALAHLLHDLGLPLTLRELGFSGEEWADRAAARAVAQGVSIPEAARDGLAFAINAELLERAVLDTDRTGRRIGLAGTGRSEEQRGAQPAGEAAPLHPAI